MTPSLKFNYVVARPWSDQDPTFCIYRWHADVQHGTLEDAQQFLAYVQRQHPDEDYQIYKVHFELLREYGECP